MKRLLLLILLSFALQLSAQDRLMFDSLQVDNHTKLIGRYPQYDKTQAYRHWNFIIEDPEEIRELIKTFTLGQEVANSTETPSFRVCVVQDQKEVLSWTVNPTLKSVQYNGHTYGFDLDKIKSLNKKYPFDYRFEKKTFTTREEYTAYLAKQKENPAFLFDYSPLFRFEGSFEIEFPRNRKFDSPRTISEYLEPLIEKVAGENGYAVQYHINEKNLANRNQFTMTLLGSKKLFEQLELPALKKENWQDSVEEGWFFYRTK